MTEPTLPHGIEYFETPLPGIRVDTAAASAVLYFNGAQLAEWTPSGQQPVLWLSPASRFEAGQAIRGGVPLVWPWFGAGADDRHRPQHGFARNIAWRLLTARVDDSGRATLRFAPGDEWQQAANRAGVPGDLGIEYHVSVGATLLLQLTVTAGAQRFGFEDGLHTYLTVGDIRRVRIEGLAGAVFTDRLTAAHHTQAGPVTFAAETDRIYGSVAATQIIDPVLHRTITVEKAGSAQTVVWNPWRDKAARMADFRADQWPRMVCVEAVNVRDQAIRLRPHQRHLLSQTIRIGSLPG